MFYVLYESYNEFNQFEGEWSQEVGRYETLKAAEAGIAFLSNRNDIQKVSSVLAEMQQPKAANQRTVYILRFTSELAGKTWYTGDKVWVDSLAEAIMFDDRKKAESESIRMQEYSRLWYPDISGDILFATLTVKDK